MHRVHRIPHPTFVTIAKRPSDERGTAGVNHTILKNGSGFFFVEGGWTRIGIIVQRAHEYQHAMTDASQLITGNGVNTCKTTSMIATAAA
jgi:hypothetical protein